MNELAGEGDVFAGDCSADVVVHTAARVHVMRDTAANPMAAFRAINVRGSLAVAHQARAAGARRFVFLSSIKVLGESSLPGQPLTASSPPMPVDAYARSKLEAEEALGNFCRESGMELAVLRPPLVYGPDVKANFDRLMRAILRRVPLPFGKLVENRRSLVGIDNLIDVVIACVRHPAVAGRALLVSDGEDLSTAELVRRLARALGVAPRLLPVPRWVLQLGGSVMGRSAAVQRLCGSLQVDISETRRILDWTAPVSVDEGLRRAAAPLLRSATR
jgi:nucleoside-diphosphate-sugar epimerase